MIFRKAKTEDFNELLSLYKKGVASMKAAGIEQWDENYPSDSIIKEDIRNSHLYVAILDGEIAAVFSLNKNIDEEYKTAAWKNPDADYIAMHRLCVNPDLHRQGIGSACMTEIERIAREQGHNSVWLDTFSGNPKAMAMYEKLGFHQVGEAFWEKGRFVIFEKNL